MSWLGSSVYDWMEELFNNVFGFLFNIVNGIFEDAESMIELDEISTASVIVADIATILISIVVIYSIINIYIFETSGDSEQDPLQLLVNASLAVALIQSYNYLFNWALNLSKIFTKEITNSEIDLGIPQGFIEELKSNINTSASTDIWVLILIIFVVGIILFIFKAFVRGGELALMKILFPIFCCDLLTASKERFNAFITSFCVTTFSYALQLLCFRLSMNSFVSINGTSDTVYFHIVFAFVWLYFAIKAPKWLEKYAYSSGLGGLARNGATSTGQVLMSAFARKVA